MRMVQNPDHPTRGVSSVSVGGKEFLVAANGVVENIPDHLHQELAGHGFLTEDQYVMRLAIQAEADREATAKAEREEDARQETERRRLQGIESEERLRVRTRFDEEARIRQEQEQIRNNQVHSDRMIDGTAVVNQPPMTESPELKVGPTGDIHPKGGEHSTPRRSVTLQPATGGPAMPTGKSNNA